MHCVPHVSLIYFVSVCMSLLHSSYLRVACCYLHLERNAMPSSHIFCWRCFRVSYYIIRRRAVSSFLGFWNPLSILAYHITGHIRRQPHIQFNWMSNMVIVSAISIKITIARIEGCSVRPTCCASAIIHFNKTIITLTKKKNNSS